MFFAIQKIDMHVKNKFLILNKCFKHWISKSFKKLKLKIRHANKLSKGKIAFTLSSRVPMRAWIRAWLNFCGWSIHYWLKIPFSNFYVIQFSISNLSNLKLEIFRHISIRSKRQSFFLDLNFTQIILKNWPNLLTFWFDKKNSCQFKGKSCALGVSKGGTRPLTTGGLWEFWAFFRESFGDRDLWDASKWPLFV